MRARGPVFVCVRGDGRVLRPCEPMGESLPR